MSEPTTLRARAAALFRRDEGVALIMAIGVVMVLTISAATAVQLVRSNQVESARDRQGVWTLGAAEAGLDTAVNSIKQTEAATPQANGTTLSGSQTFDGRSVTWSAAKAADGSAWTLTATAKSPDGKVTKVLERQLEADTTTIPGVDDPAYGYGFFMGDPTADCTVLSGSGNSIGNSAQVTVPVYIASSLCLSGGAAPLIANPSGGPKISLYVGGKLRTEGNSSPVGLSTDRLSRASIVGGCFYKKQNKWWSIPCDTTGSPTSTPAGSGIWADAYDSTPQALKKPVVDATKADYWYQNAAPGPKNPCGTGSTVGPLRFDSAGSTTRDSSLGTVRLLYLSGAWGAGNNFDCRFYDGDGNLIGRLAWTFGQPGTLIVQGTIFIDGNLDFEGTDQAIYSGKGTIYVNGTVTFANGARLCGTTMVSGHCSGNWDPTQNALEIVAVNSGNANPGWNHGGDAEFEGIAYTNGRYVSGDGAWVQGPVIADSGQLSGDTKFKAISSVPPGAPGGAQSVTTTVWNPAPGSWRQCPAATGCP